jgi:methylglyoxal synthase
MIKKKRIALVAHDNRKKDLLEWVGWNREILGSHHLICTGTKGKLVENLLNNEQTDKRGDIITIKKLKSGPLGGDQQLGAMISEGQIDILIFLWDPMQQQPHDVDVKALLRIAVVYNVTTASNRATADFIISSKLFREDYQPILKDYSKYIMRDTLD